MTDNRLITENASNSYGRSAVQPRPPLPLGQGNGKTEQPMKYFNILIHVDL